MLFSGRIRVHAQAAACGWLSAALSLKLFYRLFLLLQLGGLGLAGAGKARLPIPGARLAYYYFVVTKSTVVALVRYLRSGTPQTWDKAKGTR